MGSRTKLAEETRGVRGVVAAALLVYSLGWGLLLGAVGAFTLLMSTYRSWDLGLIVFGAMAAIVFGGGFGLVIGLFVGLTLGLIATISPPRSRISIITAAIPLVALTASMSPLTLLVGGRAFGALTVALDATLTLIGAAWIYSRYRRLEDRLANRPVH